jgi:hypothetical protein
MLGAPAGSADILSAQREQRAQSRMARIFSAQPLQTLRLGGEVFSPFLELS